MATASAVSANKAELIAIADAVAREKLIDRMIVIEAMEDAIQRAARARYGAENDIRAKLDPTSGDLRLWRVVEVVEEVEDYFKQVSLEDSQKLQPGAQLGDFIVDPLPPIEFGRIAAQAAKQVIFQKVRDAERERQFEEFKDRTARSSPASSSGSSSATSSSTSAAPRASSAATSRSRARCCASATAPAADLNVRREKSRAADLPVRAHPDFMKKLFAQEVPEIYDGIIEIKAAARDPAAAPRSACSAMTARSIRSAPASA
jgi:N utilization substance protein A